MEQSLGKQKNAHDRIEFLSSNCDRVEQIGYMRRFLPEQLVQMKETLSEVDIKLNDVEEELAAVKQDFKARLKPLEDERKRLLSCLKSKAEYVTESCYKIIDYDAREVGFYNAEGDLVESRQAFSGELQGNLFNAKTGTNQ
jgi:flagellar motility protein MotE (MotC chaperone)